MCFIIYIYTTTFLLYSNQLKTTELSFTKLLHVKFISYIKVTCTQFRFYYYNNYIFFIYDIIYIRYIYKLLLKEITNIVNTVII